MFNKIKALKDIRSQAKTIEKALSSVEVTGESKGVQIRMNGKQEILDITIPEELDRDQIGKAVKNAFESAIKDVQKQVQKVMQETGGFPDLSQLGM